MTIRIALYQPDIPGNTGTILRMAVCFGLYVEIIGPAGFSLSDRSLRRAGMDYLHKASFTYHTDFLAFDAWRRKQGQRLILFSSSAVVPYTKFSYASGDILIFGRESAGVSDFVRSVCDEQLLIPMISGRSLNLAVSVAMAAGESLRQLSPSHF